MYMRLFADRYLEEVAGLVLVDSAHIDQFEHNAMVLPPESPNESESQVLPRVVYQPSDVPRTAPPAFRARIVE